ncbi:hypothetical protein ACVQFM_003236 [Yersinia enterocolitica]
MYMLILQLLSFGLCLSGTVLMFLFSHSVESPPLAEFGDIEDERQIDGKNTRRVKMQRLGISLLSLSFLTQGAGIFFTHFPL